MDILILLSDFLVIFNKTLFEYCLVYFKENDGCTMGGPLFVTFSNIYLTKLEKDQIIHLNLSFIAGLWMT